jgi:hypothetical protein
MRLWSIARVDLGLGSDEFWGLAPCQFVELLRRKELQITRDEWGSGLVASALYNIFTRKKRSDRIVKPQDLMPSFVNKEKESSGKSMEQMMAIAKAITKDLGGRVGTNSS